MYAQHHGLRPGELPNEFFSLWPGRMEMRQECSPDDRNPGMYEDIVVLARCDGQCFRDVNRRAVERDAIAAGFSAAQFEACLSKGHCFRSEGAA